MRVAIHQPHYLPWLGLLEKWRRADLLILLDTVQFEKGGWQNRCKLPDGRWLTVPVRDSGKPKIKDVRVVEDGWRARHWKTLAGLYGGIPAWLRTIYDTDWPLLAPLCQATMRGLAPDAPPMLWASELDAPSTDPTQRLVQLCQSVGATTYLHGAGALNYMDPRPFTEADIALELVTGDWPPYTALAA